MLATRNYDRAFRQCLLERYGYKCGICDKAIQSVDECEVDHKIPVVAGGTDDLDNLQPSHPACNQHKGSSLEGDYSAGRELGLKELEQDPFYSHYRCNNKNRLPADYVAAEGLKRDVATNARCDELRNLRDMSTWFWEGKNWKRGALDVELPDYDENIEPYPDTGIGVHFFSPLSVNEKEFDAPGMEIDGTQYNLVGFAILSNHSYGLLIYGENDWTINYMDVSSTSYGKDIAIKITTYLRSEIIGIEPSLAPRPMRRRCKQGSTQAQDMNTTRIKILHWRKTKKIYSGDGKRKIGEDFCYPVKSHFRKHPSKPYLVLVNSFLKGNLDAPLRKATEPKKPLTINAVDR